MTAALDALSAARNAARDEALKLRGQAIDARDGADRADAKASRLEADAEVMERAAVSLGGALEPFKPFFERGPTPRPVDNFGNPKTVAVGD